MLTAVLMNIALLAAGDEVQDSVVPTLKMAMALSPLTAEIFTLILLCGIFSTAAPMLWTICKSLAGEGSRSSRILALLLCLDALVLGQLPFDRLVAAIYPVSGYMGLFLLLCIAGAMENKALQDENKRQGKREYLSDPDLFENGCNAWSEAFSPCPYLRR